MSAFFGVLRYEYRMSIQRKGLLILALLFSAFYIYLLLDSGSYTESALLTNRELLQEAGHTMFFINLFFPVFAGISAADRLVRDYRLGTREILQATGVSNVSYVAGKYLGTVFSLLSIEFVIVFLITAMMVLVMGVSAVMIAYTLYALTAISAPALFFITAFSLACPMIMPVRIYQILFTGYWFWGNYLSPTVLPTLSDTLLNASGRHALQAFFGATISAQDTPVPASDAVLNIFLLLLCAGLALSVLVVYIRRTEQRS
ncbi:MAG: hypothetical protein JXA25_11980 [Anaerolineales bacterium]|nr:hypothetical protein [Anaerolineales bacterium]